MEHHINMHEQIFKPITAFIGTLAGALTFTGVLQGVGLVLGVITALFSALYWFEQWKKTKQERIWDEEDRESE